jgi:hypothetical protein
MSSWIADHSDRQIWIRIAAVRIFVLRGYRRARKAGVQHRYFLSACAVKRDVCSRPRSRQVALLLADIA